LKHGLAAAKTRGSIPNAQTTLLAEELVRLCETWEEAKLVAEGVLMSHGVHRRKADIWRWIA
jgi:hypothetical protein